MAIVFVRTLIVFFMIIITMRLMGKRQLGELELSELVIAVIMSDLASNPLQDIGIPLMNGVVPIMTLFCCELIISALMMKSIKMRVLLCGRPSMLVSDGRIDESQMRKNRFTLDELTEELRNQGITDISTIKFAILETDGTLNTILYPAEQPVTASQMGIVVPDPGYPTIVINDGTVIEKNLQRIGLDSRWLAKQLKSHGISRPSDVYLMTVDNDSRIYFVAKERRKK